MLRNWNNRRRITSSRIRVVFREKKGFDRKVNSQLEKKNGPSILLDFSYARVWVTWFQRFASYLRSNGDGRTRKLSRKCHYAYVKYNWQTVYSLEAIATWIKTAPSLITLQDGSISRDTSSSLSFKYFTLRNIYFSTYGLETPFTVRTFSTRLHSPSCTLRSSVRFPSILFTLQIAREF